MYFPSNDRYMSFSALTSLLCTIYLDMYLHINPITTHEQSQWYLRDYWQMSSSGFLWQWMFFFLETEYIFIAAYWKNGLQEAYWIDISIGDAYPWDSFSNANTLCVCVCVSVYTHRCTLRIQSYSSMPLNCWVKIYRMHS